MNWKMIFLIALGLNLQTTLAQDEVPYIEKGHLSLGLRTTTSLFGYDNVPGLGTGGQFRLQLFDRLSTEWFADWITMDLKGAGTRNSAHIGWSVLFYPLTAQKVTPYLIAGHCFDYNQITPLSTAFVDRSGEQIDRWSSAVQAGIGSHFFLSERFNVSFAAHYMLHLGEHLDYELQSVGSGYFLNMSNGGAHEAGFEGHILLTLSINYRIGDLW
jgi:hypothetical protein